MRWRILSISFGIWMLFSCNSDDNPQAPEPEEPSNELSAIHLQSVSIENGTILLRWNEMTNYNFTEALLTISGTGYYNQVSLSHDDIRALVYNDQISVKNNLSYQITLSNEENEISSNTVYLSYQDIDISERLIGLNQLELTVDQHPLYANFDYYEYYDNDATYEFTSEGGIFTIDFDYEFEEQYRHYVSFRRDNDDNELDRFINSFNFHQNNTPGIGFRDLLFSEEYNAFFGIQIIGPSTSGSTHQVYIHQLDAETLSITNSNYLFSISDNWYYDLAYDISNNQLIIDVKNKSYVLNPASMTIQQIFDANDYMYDPTNGTSSQIHKRMSYRNGSVFIYSFNSVNVFNANSAESLHSEERGSFDYFVSDDGSFLYNNDHIYRINPAQNQVQLIKETEFSPDKLIFVPERNEIIYANHFEYPKAFNYANLVTRDVLGVVDVKTLSYDVVSDVLLIERTYFEDGEEKGKATFFNMNTGTTSSCSTYPIHTSGFYRTILNNKYIAANGNFINLNF